MATKQRKKTDKDEENRKGSRNSANAAAATAASKQTSKKVVNDNDNDNELTDQLNRTQMAVERNHATAQVLHSQWRTQLLRMAYLVMIVTLHMAQGPSGACIQDIKKYNAEHIQAESIPGTQAIKIILYDSIVEILGIVCAMLIVWCLRSSINDTSATTQISSPVGSLSLSTIGYNEFSSLPYRLSCAVLPMIISLHFQFQPPAPTEEQQMEESPSCLSGITTSTSTSPFSVGPLISRNFPVILVFHLIVSISLWFMQYQNQQHVKNMELVQKLQQDLLHTKKKTKPASRGEKGSKS